MTIHLPKEVESSILAAVHDGQFASLDDAMTKAATLLLERLKQQQVNGPTGGEVTLAKAHEPIWEEIQELTADVSDEEWAKLPPDLAEQHDHYIYGTPKRPPSP